MTARLTGDAKISTLKNDRQVVNFSVAINDSYKAKGISEVTKIVTYVQCDYWVNPAIARYLTKGILVELQGRVGVNAYTGKDGEAKATLTFHVNTIKLHGNGKQQDNNAKIVPMEADVKVPADDLPF
ncbi:single-stranded DNA-binding protein [Agriterribacter sp.]|uniref:single-stranded DNA-binding protein n=1 Tax=Agriterribacter sp. TaxID=2821509 RepID=UPI002C21114B|nr:single-stranded DNA-binding protein [Agriterribacter sp.]HTN07589.1 single-stranded DNA-binding protein [Agriterribacter sp.]